MIYFVMEACKGKLHQLLEQGLSELEAIVNSSCWYIVSAFF
jgi:hypothetical protein